jgi:hypothetical protein
MRGRRRDEEDEEGVPITGYSAGRRRGVTTRGWYDSEGERRMIHSNTTREARSAVEDSATRVIGTKGLETTRYILRLAGV